tara:strand:- start:6140 stop:7009 length:870 start_codon:yes stop_codon:yes gene_type:complete
MEEYLGLQNRLEGVRIATPVVVLGNADNLTLFTGYVHGKGPRNKYIRVTQEHPAFPITEREMAAREFLKQQDAGVTHALEKYGSVYDLSDSIPDFRARQATTFDSRTDTDEIREALGLVGLEDMMDGTTGDLVAVFYEDRDMLPEDTRDITKEDTVKRVGFAIGFVHSYTTDNLTLGVEHTDYTGESQWTRYSYEQGKAHIGSAEQQKEKIDTNVRVTYALADLTAYGIIATRAQIHEIIDSIKAESPAEALATQVTAALAENIETLALQPGQDDPAELPPEPPKALNA